MKTNRLGNVLTTVTNVGVIIGLVAVVYELNQNTLATIGTTQQGVLQLVHDRESWVLDKDFAKVVYNAEILDEPLEGVQALQYTYWITGKINICEHVFERYREGLLTYYYWEGWDSACKALLSSNQGHAVWTEARTFYGREFREYLDGYANSL